MKSSSVITIFIHILCSVIIAYSSCTRLSGTIGSFVQDSNKLISFHESLPLFEITFNRFRVTMFGHAIWSSRQDHWKLSIAVIENKLGELKNLKCRFELDSISQSLEENVFQRGIITYNSESLASVVKSILLVSYLACWSLSKGLGIHSESKDDSFCDGRDRWEVRQVLNADFEFK